MKGEDEYDKMSKWDLRFLRLAREVGLWSKDPSSKVGAVVVSPDRAVIIPGYNGFAKGVPDLPEHYSNREIKYQMVQHAEKNAIRYLSHIDVGWSLYSTHMPCPQCAGAIIQKGIKRVCWVRQLDYQERWKEQLWYTIYQFRHGGVLTSEYLNEHYTIEE